MQNEEPMCYITYTIPARLMPKLPLGEAVMSIESVPEEPKMLYPDGFMPDWFLNGRFPEDDIDD